MPLRLLHALATLHVYVGDYLWPYVDEAVPGMDSRTGRKTTPIWPLSQV